MMENQLLITSFINKTLHIIPPKRPQKDEDVSEAFGVTQLGYYGFSSVRKTKSVSIYGIACVVWDR